MFRRTIYLFVVPWIEYYHKGGLVIVEGVHTDSVLQLSLQIKAIKVFSQASVSSGKCFTFSSKDFIVKEIALVF